MEFEHRPVLLQEVLTWLAPRSGGVYVDATVGGGGHAVQVAQRISPGGRLVGIDRDPAAVAAAAARLEAEAPRDVVWDVRHANFAELDVVLDGLGIGSIDGVLFDLGVSSVQFDNPARGFTYREDAPLDMRMDPSRGQTARDLVNEAPEETLRHIIATYGEERWAARIARFIVERRRQAPIETTGDLVQVIKEAIPAAARRRGPHPARRTFQALRIAVNDELGSLERGLQAAIARLAPGGRVVVISFHSLEDRIVKQAFREAERGCICPPELPACRCGRRPVLRILTRRPVTPSPEEIHVNPRARSAKLRAAERVLASTGGE